MIRTALVLLRTSLPSVLVLSVALVTLATILTDEPDDPALDAAGAMPSLAPLPKRRADEGAGAAALRSALFDPDRRPETVAGSIDDLRPEPPIAPAAPVTIAGVLLSGDARKAMLSLGGAAPAWSTVGSEIGGWRVAAIDAEGAVVERDGQSVTLRVADRLKLRGKPQPDSAAPAMPQGDAGPPQADAGPPPEPPADPTDGPPPPSP